MQPAYFLAQGFLAAQGLPGFAAQGLLCAGAQGFLAAQGLLCLAAQGLLCFGAQGLLCFGAQGLPWAKAAPPDKRTTAANASIIAFTFLISALPL
ncbi:MAG: hypothetical protein A3J27_06955 [Candidatus Tectomicrobia bacterium RIFCSPLOWO2_12_FULL_69_37]|nr:MAG: hypothetical protein A3J27_06955 [Candidatus Tectomicrobia bacterium RIFCSPLOWO2_12_FULL_69_37]